MTSPRTWRRAGARFAAVGAIAVVGVAAAALPAFADDDITYNMWLSADENYSFNAIHGEDLGPQAGVFEFQAWEWGDTFGDGTDITLEFAAEQDGVTLELLDPSCAASGASTVCEIADYQLEDWIQLDVEVTFSPEFDPVEDVYYAVETTFSQDGEEQTETSFAQIPVRSGDAPEFSHDVSFADGELYPESPWVSDPQEATLAVTADYLPASVEQPADARVVLSPWDGEVQLATEDERCTVATEEDGYTTLVCDVAGWAEGDTVELQFTLDNVPAWTETLDSYIQISVPDATYGDWYLDYDASWPIASDEDWTQYPVENTALEGLAPGTSIELPAVRFNATGEQNVPGLIIEMGGFNGSAIALAAEYDNCLSEDEGNWLLCVVPGFDPAAGQTYQISDATPVTVNVSETAAGPYTYTGRTWISYDSQTWYAEEYPELFKDSYDNPLQVEAAAEAWTPETDDPEDTGYIELTTTENRYDLTTSPVAISGKAGDLVTADFAVHNDSGADAEGALVAVDLPAGVALEPGAYEDSEYGEGWCQTPQEWWSEEQGNADVICSVWDLEAGTTTTLPLKLEIVGGAASTDGLVAVAEFYYGSDEQAIETVVDNNAATVSYTGASSGGGELPSTGSSMTLVIGSAAAVLVAGAGLFVFMRRRRAAANW